MSGNITGGRKARDTILKTRPDHYREVGKIGGSRKVPKGFAINRELASRAGKKGGSNSRRGKEVTSEDVHRARMLRERGYTWGEIGKTMDCSRERARYLFLRSEDVDKSSV